MHTKIFALVTTLALFGAAFAEDTDLRRDQIFRIVDSYEAVSSRLFEAPFNSSMSRQLRLQVAAIPQSELASADPAVITQFKRLEQTIAEISMIQSAASDKSQSDTSPKPATLQSMASTSQDFPQPRNIDLSWTVSIDNNGQPDDDAPGTIGSNGDCDSTDPLNGRQRYDLQTSAIALEAVADIAGKICGQEALVGDASIACVVTDVAFVIAAGINENVQNCEALIDTVTLVGSHARLDHIAHDLEDLSSGITEQVRNSRSDVESKLSSAEKDINDEIVDITGELIDSAETASDGIQVQLDASEAALLQALGQSESELIGVVKNNAQAVSETVDTRSDGIDAAIAGNFSMLATFRSDNLRYHIEQNLSEKSGWVASFVLPESHGGVIETVDSIVDETVQSVSSTTGKPQQARKDYDRARSFYDQGRFKDAYKWYRSAYQHANSGG